MERIEPFKAVAEAWRTAEEASHINPTDKLILSGVRFERRLRQKQGSASPAQSKGSNVSTEFRRAFKASGAGEF